MADLFNSRKNKSWEKDDRKEREEREREGEVLQKKNNSVQGLSLGEGDISVFCILSLLRKGLVL